MRPFWFFLFFGVCLFSTSIVFSAKEKTEPPKKEKTMLSQTVGKTGYQPVELVEKKTDPQWDYPYLFAAYALTWVLFLLYVLSLRRNLRQTEEKLEKLENHLNSFLQNNAGN